MAKFEYYAHLHVSVSKDSFPSNNKKQMCPYGCVIEPFCEKLNPYQIYSSEKHVLLLLAMHYLYIFNMFAIYTLSGLSAPVLKLTAVSVNDLHISKAIKRLGQLSLSEWLVFFSVVVKDGWDFLLFTFLNRRCPRRLSLLHGKKFSPG